jgi:hypothetical protein
MIPYASAMGAGRNRQALLDAGWGLLVSPLDPRDVTGFRYCLDNGAWPAFQAWLKARLTTGMSEDQAMGEWIGGRWAEGLLDEDRFERALERYGAGADFVVLPDIVAGGMESLAMSLRWSNRCQSSSDVVLIAVQDGMEPADLENHVSTRVGIFLGGSTPWKLASAEKWGRWCASRPCRHPLSTPSRPRQGCWYHFARVNTERRFRLAHAAGADSVDGSSATKFADTLPLLQRAVSQPDLYDPRRA